ncbi:hypothetical protein [Sphingomonas flavalba]|uniref:hypothetical protein n=1 Tax=Sphingomonas flavalba TaxID=2559804 RepID=UPI001445456B|nr:hypothetical protein [Sphingomonas flavalba]
MTHFSTTADDGRLDSYSLSLQSAARALWGDEAFWGRHRPRIRTPQADGRTPPRR